jgi:GrpB-like predicted nucleotidyltransferase (UPF0157 family)
LDIDASLLAATQESTDGAHNGPVDSEHDAGPVTGSAAARALDEYLDRVLVGGREHRRVEIVAYEVAWPARYEAERARIGAALGTAALRIEHVGSTAVPGLAAKPIVDILVAVDDPSDEAAVVRPLEDAGYVLRVREEGHRMLRTPAGDVHIHLWRSGSDDERRHLLFRDWLRHDGADRARYASAKRALAEKDWPDMNHYAEAKGPVIAEIMGHAEAWAGSGAEGRRGS